MTDRSLQDRAVKGAAVKALLQNPLLSEIMEKVRLRFFHDWCGTAPGEEGALDREELHQLYVAAIKFDEMMGAYAKDGDLADREIKSRTRDRVKEFADA